MTDSKKPPTGETAPAEQSNSQEESVRWDYTSREGTLYTGAAVVGLNLIVVILLILDRTVPSIHSFFTGKPLQIR